MEHETIRGRLLYTSKKPEIMDKVRGGETGGYDLNPNDALLHPQGET